jgi:ribose transport system substrate-binding protein
MRRTRVLVAGLAAAALTLSACTTDAPTEQAPAGGGETEQEQSSDGEWFVQAEYDKQLAQRDQEP